jgi:hypothetical protein
VEINNKKIEKDSLIKLNKMSSICFDTKSSKEFVNRKNIAK